MTATTTTSETRTELLARRREVLADVCMTAEEMYERMVLGALVADEWAAAEELMEIERLLEPGGA